MSSNKQNRFGKNSKPNSENTEEFGIHSVFTDDGS